jgi:DNA polymerase-3 subunit beta
MEFRIQKTEFLRGLRLAQSIADRKSTMPMLANVLLRATGKGKLLVAATDLNVSVSADLASQNKTEGGLTVGAKALHDIVSSMPGEDLVVRRAENNWAEIRAGKVEYRVVGMPDRDFPKIPDHREVEFARVEAAVLRDMIDKTLFSVSKKGLVEMKRTLDTASGTCDLAIKTPYAFVRTGDITVAVKLIEADFPPYQAVIPKDNTRKAVIDRQVLSDALKRAQLMSSETRGVKLSLSDGALNIAGDNPDIGEVHEELEVEYAGDDVSVGFNPKYVIELLAQMESQQVSLELNGELDPGLLRPADGDDYLGVVMPMRI